MKILYLITSWDFGGAEMQVLALAETMQKQSHKVLVVSMIKPNTDFLLKSKGITVKTLSMSKGFPDARAIFRFKKILKNYKPNVVHAHMIHAVLLGRISRIFIKIPRLISTAHNINEGGKIRELMYRYTDFLSDTNTNVSQSGLDLYLKKGIFKKESNSFFIPNGIFLPNSNDTTKNKNSLRKSLGVNKETFLFLAIGRLEAAKDYQNLFEATKILLTKTTTFKILIAGEGTLRKPLEQSLQELKLSNNITLLGRRNDIPNLLQAADAFIMSSAWEGLPIAILEAASYGMPMLVTDVGGCKEAVENNKNGFVVPPKNSNELANAMLNIMQVSDIKINEMRAYSLAKIKNNYEMGIIIQKWLTLYQG